MRLSDIYSISFISQHNSDLLALIQVMTVTFGEQPPVYAKSKIDVQSTSTPYPVQRKCALLLKIKRKNEFIDFILSAIFRDINLFGPAAFMPVPGSGSVSSSGFPPYPSNSQYSGGGNVYPPYPSSASSGYPYTNPFASYTGNASYPTQGYTGSYPPYPPVTQPVIDNHLLL